MIKSCTKKSRETFSWALIMAWVSKWSLSSMTSLDTRLSLINKWLNKLNLTLILDIVPVPKQNVSEIASHTLDKRIPCSQTRRTSKHKTIKYWKLDFIFHSDVALSSLHIHFPVNLCQTLWFPRSVEILLIVLNTRSCLSFWNTTFILLIKLLMNRIKQILTELKSNMF